MDLVRIARRLAQPAGDSDTALSSRERGWWWTAITADLMAVIWMLQQGKWLDTAPLWGSMATYGGFHWVVFGLSATGLALLVALAPLTHGFARASRTHRVLLPIAGVLSVAALAGLLSVILLLAGALLVVALLLLASRGPTRRR